MEEQESSAIAIIGMSGRFPGARGLDEFWRNLRDGVEAVQLFSEQDLAASGADPALLLDPSYVRAGSVLEDVDRFDAAFFGISPREAELLDPQHRIFMECAWEALENAGYDPTAYEGAIGVYAGANMSSYLTSNLHQHPAMMRWPGWFQTLIGNDKDYLATHVSYRLNLRGPSISVQTACSTSLVAVHMACMSLLDRECDMALAGGITVRIPHRAGYVYAEGGIFSPDGHCRAFDAKANGTIMGNGCGLVVLKPLDRALADGDPVRAVILGSATNNDGARKIGFTAPSEAGQAQAIVEALALAGVEARSIQYIETHGTGTLLGDAIEIAALRRVFGRDASARRSCAIGSVKTGIGHLESAAGIAGLIKTVLALEHRQLPPSLNFESPNPSIDFANSPFYVNTSLKDWNAGSAPRRAGVSSFGIGGTNAHVVLEEAPAAKRVAAAPARAAELFVVSAKSAAALDAAAARLRDHLQARQELSLGDVAFSLATTRSPMEHRLAVAAPSREALQAALDAAAQGQTPPGAVRGRASTGGVPKVVFVFPGQGSQWAGMGQELLAEEPVFREALSACDRAIQAEAGWSLLAELAAEEATSQLGRIDVVQPALFAVSVALSALWRSWGVQPDAVVGHSMGEVAAAHVAGALSLEDAVTIICRRSRLLRRISGQGEMAVVELSLPEAEAALRGYEDRLSVAVSNSPRSTVLSGEPAALSEVLAAHEAKGVFCRRVKVDVASHSPQVDPLREDLLAALGALRPRAATVPMRSTVTGAMVAGPELGARYWADNLRQPVRFAEAVQALLQGGHGLFVEMSPHPILATSVEEMRHAAQRAGAAVGSLRRGQDERPAMLEALGALWVHGYPVPWGRLYPAGGRRVPLPTYPWQRERYWIEAPAKSAAGGRRGVPAGGHPLLGEMQTLSTQTSTRLWETTLDLGRLPWLGDHRVQGAVVFPGAAYLEMALSSGAEALGDGPLQITDVELAEALAFAGDAAVLVQVVTTEQPSGRLQFQIASRAPGAGHASFRVHARGALRRAERDEAPEGLPLSAVRARLRASVPAAAAYAELTEMGLEYGPAFRGIVELWRGEGEALGRLRLPEAAGSAAEYRLHPALLDACFQVIGSLFAGGGEATPWVPVEVGSLRLSQRPSGELWCHARVVSHGHQTPDRQGADFWVVDSSGAVVAEVRGLVAQRLSGGARRREEDDWFLELAWEPAAVGAAKNNAGRWLLLGAGGGLGAALRSRLEAFGHAVVHAAEDMTSAAGVRALLAEAFGGQAPTAVVHLGSLDGGGELAPGLGAQGAWDEPRSPDAATDALEAALVRGCDSVLWTVQALAGVGFRDAPRLWLLTRGAQAVRAGFVSVAQAPLLGLGRVIAMEHADLRCARVDLDPARPEGELDVLLAELLADDAEEEVALRGGERRVARLVRRQPEAQPRERVERGAPAESGVTLRADSTYLVTGGLGGLGLSVAGWLAERGAGHLVLVGRSGAASAEQQAAVEALAAHGARVTVAKADVADRAQLEQVLREVAASGMPLRGVVHAAGVLDDGLLMQQTPARFRKVMAPKVQGALHLHALTREAPLSFFVLYSSGVGLLGSPGQGNYAAANTFLDALAHHRRAQGLPALSVDWGLFAEVGLAAAQADRGARLVSRGMRSLTPGEGLSALARLLEGDRAQVGVMPLDPRLWVELYPAAASSRTLSYLVTAHRASAGRPAGDRDLLGRLAAAEPGARGGLLEPLLRAQVSQVLRLPEGKIEADAPLTSLGMNSLMGLELRNRIEAMLGITVPATLLWTYPTVAALSGHLARETCEAAPGESPHTTADPAAEIDEMSQDDLTQLIAAKFEALT
ncbi:type I polyketide synthase [Sorangium sp. So ce385]|uniref:type I polyketide synthase n=1 Tax=Sorangium sp. So ce385 TaxID=3133308 RepID=UPI003F5AE57D